MHIRKNMIQANEGFTCANPKCGKKVGKHEAGSCRNHCPYCLYSLHVDLAVPGDRASECEGLMVAIAMEANKKKGVRVKHLCQSCGHMAWNRMAPDDNWELICELSRIPQE